MAKFLHGDDANNPFLQRDQLREGWDMRRGKVVPRPRAAWGMTDANGKGVDYEGRQKLLDESER